MLNDIAVKIEKVLSDEENGLLMKFHFGKGLDLEAVNELCGLLEVLKDDWRDKHLVPKEIVYSLVTIVPTLFSDLPLYKDSVEQSRYRYLIQGLDIAIAMCFKPNVTADDPHFFMPLVDIVYKW